MSPHKVKTGTLDCRARVGGRPPALRPHALGPLLHTVARPARPLLHNCPFYRPGTECPGVLAPVGSPRLGVVCASACILRTVKNLEVSWMRDSTPVQLSPPQSASPRNVCLVCCLVCPSFRLRPSSCPSFRLRTYLCPSSRPSSVFVRLPVRLPVLTSPSSRLLTSPSSRLPVLETGSTFRPFRSS